MVQAPQLAEHSGIVLIDLAPKQARF